MMNRLLALAVLFLSASGAQDTPQKRWQESDGLWSSKSGLMVEDVAVLRRLAGLTDTTTGARVLHLDAESFKQRGHILFAEAGAGHCMRIHVFQRTSGAFRIVWQLSQTPDLRWTIDGEPANGSGRGICPQGSRFPTVQAAANGNILIEVAVRSDPFVRSIPVARYEFRWNGVTYAIVEQQP